MLQANRYSCKMAFKSGFIAICGRPNTGKTTLLNRVLGHKVGIVSAKPQTTRHRILGVHTDEQAQMVFLDTPGLNCRPTELSLDQRIQANALEALKEADLALLLFDATREWGEEDALVTKQSKESGVKRIAVLNKVDRLADKAEQERTLQEIGNNSGVATLLPVSAKSGEGLSQLLATIRKHLPDGPLYYPNETLTDQTERFLAAEIIREKIFKFTGQEVPYACAVIVEAYKESTQQLLVQAVIVVDRQALKKILIGKRGATIKRIGMAAREELEANHGKKVHVELFVKVHKNWRQELKTVKAFGY